MMTRISHLVQIGSALLFQACLTTCTEAACTEVEMLSISMVK